jgi:hypothetical protein
MQVPLPEGKFRMPIIFPFSYDLKYVIFSTLEEIRPFMYIYNVKLRHIEEEAIKPHASPLRMV